MLQKISAQVSKLPKSVQIETMIKTVKDASEETLIEIRKHINNLKNESASAQGHERRQLAACTSTDQTMVKTERYHQVTTDDPRTAWWGQLATQVIGTGITSAITGAIIPSSISMTAMKFTLKLPRR